MENVNKESLNRYLFLADNKAHEVFAGLDYHLRNGVHIQRDYPLPGELFRFIDKYFESLEAYYNDFFRIILTKGGNEFETFYFIDFEEGNRGRIPTDNREYLKTEHVIIGMLFLKMYKFDGNIDLERVSSFAALLFNEYEEEKEALRKLIADASGDKSSDFSDYKIEEVITRAFAKFNDLGWIKWDSDKLKDRFTYMPSFERLRSLYEAQITGIGTIIKKASDE